MIGRHTHTYSVLDLSPVAYEEIRGKLLAADYHHAFHQDMDGRDVIDMHGIAVAKEAAEEPARDRSATRALAPDCSGDIITQIFGDGI